MDPLSPRERAAIRRLGAVAPEAPAGERNVVPFLDILVNVMMFVIASLPVVFTTTLESKASAAEAPGPRDPAPRLGLVVVLTHEGAKLATTTAAFGPGCVEGPGLVAETHDLAPLRRCAARLKASDPAFASETEVRVVSDPGVPLQRVVDVLAALREDESGSVLFPEPRFAAVR